MSNDTMASTSTIKTWQERIRQLTAELEVARTAGPAVPEELVEIGNRMATTLEVLATALKNPGTVEGVRCTVEEWRAAAPKPQEDA